MAVDAAPERVFCAGQCLPRSADQRPDPEGSAFPWPEYSGWSRGAFGSDRHYRTRLGLARLGCAWPPRPEQAEAGDLAAVADALLGQVGHLVGVTVPEELGGGLGEAPGLVD